MGCGLEASSLEDREALTSGALLNAWSRKGPALPALRSEVQQVFQITTAEEGLDVLNAKLVQICKRLFPVTPRRPDRPSGQPGVLVRIIRICGKLIGFKVRRRNAPAGALFGAWRAYARFTRSWRALRLASRQERRGWFTPQISLAHTAAQQQNMGEVYRIVRLLAPKQRREPIRIRTEDGHLLDGQQQFDAIFEYFSRVIDRTLGFEHDTSNAGLSTTTEGIVQSIATLKPRKSVLPGCPPAELWQLCPSDSADFFQGVLRRACDNPGALPARMTDCELSLLPKPGKTSRFPKDLRPLGLQDPSSSKVLASAPLRLRFKT